MKIYVLVALMAGLMSNAFAAPMADDKASVGESTRVEILNVDSYLRIFMGWQTPVIANADGSLSTPTVGKEAVPMRQVAPTPLPVGWVKADFDDRGWAREHAPIQIERWYGGGMMTAEYHLIAARGKFRVDDPVSCQNLQLELSYIGGTVIYLNGKEIARAHLPTGKLQPDTLADKYPDECYLDANGFRIDNHKEEAERVAKRIRRHVMTIASADFVKGVNVLAIEVHRAPISETYLKARYEKSEWRGERMVWSHVALTDVTLSAKAGSGLRSNTVRPQGFQVWTANGIETLLQWHYGDPCEQPGLALLAPRGGRAGGWIVVSSTTALSGVKAMAGDLVACDGVKIPSSAVKVFYTEPSAVDKTFNNNPGYDGLLDTAPVEAKISADAPKAFWGMPYSVLAKPPVPGANQPVWVSVNVPATAKPGIYTGQVRVQATGLEPVDVPISIQVATWQMPDDDHLVSMNNLYHSHESSAFYYQVPLWSDQHFEHMGKVLELSKGLGNRLCMIHLIKEAYHLGNHESMIRWIRRADGGYDHDFTIFDRYLDLYAKKIGKPAVVLLSVFHPYVDAKDTNGIARSATVSLLNKETGQIENLRVPDYGTPAGAAFWKPVLDAVFQRLQKRGWLDAVVLGTSSDNGPKTPDPVTMFKEIWPDCRLMFSGHPNVTFYNTRDKVRVPVTCREHVWSAGILYNPDGNLKVPPERQGGNYPMPWKRNEANLEWGFMRVGVACIDALYERARASVWRMVEESTLQGNLCGVGRVGLDFWPLPTNQKGREQYRALSGSVDMHLGPSASTRMFLYPGTDGAVPTWRSELFREGLQVREAIIFLQQALDSGRADDVLARRVKELLDERARYYLRTRAGSPMHWVAFEGSNWQARDAALFTLCAEVGRVAP